MARVQTVFGEYRNKPGDSLSRNGDFYSIQVRRKRDLAQNGEPRRIKPDKERANKPNEQQ